MWYNSHMKNYLSAAVLAGFCAAVGATSAPSARMDRSKLLIGAYCLQGNAKTEAHVKAIRDCGVDFTGGLPTDYKS